MLARALEAPVSLEADPLALSVQCAAADRGADAVTKLASAGIGVADFSLGQPSLDEVFLALTGRTGEEAAQTAEGTAVEDQVT